MWGSESLRPGSIVILTQQIAHYHAARFRAAKGVFERLTVISTMNAADFEEFLSRDLSNLNIVQLFDGRDSYIAAVHCGQVRPAVHSALDKLGPSLVVVAGWSSPESLSAIAWARANGARTVMMSESQEHDATRRGLREAIKSRVVSACDAALVGGRMQRDYIVRLGMPRESVFFGYDAVDNWHFSDGADRARADAITLRRRHSLPERYILASARFIPKKNLDKLLTAFARALELAPAPHHLVILGDGPVRAALQTAIASAGLGSRVVLAGFKDYESLPAFYGLADAFVHVSLAEQWGLVLNEAAAAGLPLVVSNVCGAAAELIEPGNNGIMVDPNDVEEMARALQRIMTLSDSERENMGGASRRIVADWGTERFAEGLRKASEAALDAPRCRLSMLDQLLMRNLARHYISDVS
jgi:glycosyltransferase involved in cell wall biosynthesis